MNRPAWALLILLAVPSLSTAQRPAVPVRAESPAPRVDSKAARGAAGGALPLPAPGKRAGESAAGSQGAKRMVMSLALVLGAFFLVAWIGRKRIVDDESLPAEAVEVLGQIALGPRETARLVRLGSKLVLIASTPQGVRPLAEVDDPEEVRHLSDLCQTMRGGDAGRRRAA